MSVVKMEVESVLVNPVDTALQLMPVESGSNNNNLSVIPSLFNFDHLPKHLCISTLPQLWGFPPLWHIACPGFSVIFQASSVDISHQTFPSVSTHLLFINIFFNTTFMQVNLVLKLLSIKLPLGWEFFKKWEFFFFF